MKPWARLGAALLLRTIARELGGIRLQLTRQGDLLERWAAQAGLEPIRSVASSAPRDLADTGVDYLDPVEQGLVQDYITKTERDTGHVPTDEQILSYLADERTVSLHARLREREAVADLARLGRNAR
jgi:hypothetical protein